MWKIAVIGYGNIGAACIAAIENAPDMRLSGLVRRVAVHPEGLDSRIPVATDIEQLGKVDCAILALPSRMVEEAAIKCLSRGISTVDSFDMHGDIPAMRERLNVAAKAGGSVAMLSVGWDPGSDSVIRALLEAMAPKGLSYTNFGPGMSMGHSVAARAIDGVKDALSMTMPAGDGVHRRLVYVELNNGADFATVEHAICSDPYFAHDDTRVKQVEDIGALRDMGHGVHLTRNGVSANAHNQRFSFDMTINNPALTGQVMVSAARAGMRQTPGCYTLIEVPPVDMLPGERDEWVKKIV